MALCPNCKEPVSQFAAGCATCGTDLEKHRRERAARQAGRRLRVPSAPRVSEVEVLLGVLALVLLAYPLAGLALGLLAAYRHPQLSVSGTPRTVLIALLAGGVVVLLATGGSGLVFY